MLIACYFLFCSTKKEIFNTKTEKQQGKKQFQMDDYADNCTNNLSL